MSQNELIAMIVGYGAAFSIAIMLIALSYAISSWLELRALRKLSRKHNLRARPRWFISGTTDL